MELKGATAIITGSTGRAAGAIAIALAHAGADCICHYHQNSRLAAELVATITSLGQKAVAVSADLTQPDEIKNLFADLKGLAPPRILINAAALFCREPLGDITQASAREIFDLNLIAPVLAAAEFARTVKENYCAHFDEPDSTGPIAKIINIADIAAASPWAEYTIYCASKAALIAATKSMAKELAPHFTANAIAPGIVTWADDIDPAEKKRQLALIPAGRIANRSELAAAVIFLLESDYITGQTLNIDGGRCI